ncbi:MAG TPA: universal stress protein [Nitrospiraceae bacterium]|jgi:nucleotide-binding universal stress UspA family protein|nr:universal stress protein [Nitrospiraceae bacterium]
MNSTQFCPISKLERLLVATDRSAFSEGAIREAMTLAKDCASSLYVISVMETNREYATTGATFFQKEEEEAIAYLESIKTRASQEGFYCQSMLLHENEPYQLIVTAAAEKMIDMIIIGRHGRTGLMKVLMGSVTAKVVGHAPCKVLVVPLGARIDYRNILIATDGSKHSIAAASEAIGIAKRCGCRIIAISVAHSEAELKEAKTHVSRVVEMAQTDGISVEALTPIGKPYDVIGETAGGRAVDLIVMGTYGETGLRKFLMGSTTERVIGHAPFAVLVVKA